MGKYREESTNFVLAPSDLTFLFHECIRCFYLKVREGIRRPASPMPKIFTVIDQQQRRFFDEKSTQDLHPEIPPGLVQCSDSSVLSAQLKVPRAAATVQFRGAVDTKLLFDDGTFGIVDFKTTNPRDSHVRMYTLQLHAYALGFENPALGRVQMAPVTTLGLLCFEPVGMVRLDKGDFAYRTTPTWIEIPRDDKSFLNFVSLALSILERSTAPAADPGCQYCALRADVAA